MDQARHTASKVKSGVPVLTGRLAATVKPSKIVGGAAVSYGGTLPYARKIERRSHAVQDGIEGAQAEFIARMTVAAEREVNSL